MVRSLAVILVPLLVITVIFTRNIGDHPVVPVDYGPVLAQARAQAPFPVLAPVNLPSDWRPTTVSWTKLGAPDPAGNPAVRNTWKLGFLAPDSIYIAIAQGDLQTRDFIDATTRSGVPDGTSTVAGTRWERRVSQDGRTRSLLLSTPKVTSIVVGDTGYEALDAFAGTLRSG